MLVLNKSRSHNRYTVRSVNSASIQPPPVFWPAAAALLRDIVLIVGSTWMLVWVALSLFTTQLSEAISKQAYSPNAILAFSLLVWIWQCFGLGLLAWCFFWGCEADRLSDKWRKDNLRWQAERFTRQADRYVVLFWITLVTLAVSEVSRIDFLRGSNSQVSGFRLVAAGVWVVALVLLVVALSAAKRLLISLARNCSYQFIKQAATWIADNAPS